jgi:hypothetical protein
VSAPTDPVHPEAARWDGWSWCEPFRGEHFRRCSYCGSIHPADLVAEPVWAPEWADRKYGWPHKFYVHIPNREPDRLYVIGGTTRFKEDDRAKGYVPVEGLTEQQRAICERDHWQINPGWGVRFGTRPTHFGKLYTIHLADPEVSDEIKEQVMAGCGLRFSFDAGQVRWCPAGREVSR